LRASFGRQMDCERAFADPTLLRDDCDHLHGCGLSYSATGQTCKHVCWPSGKRAC
jgi:hypothetical protein